MWRWGAICLIFTKYILVWAPTKKLGLYSQKWLHNDLICLYFPFFVGWLMWRLGAISLIFTKYILIWAPTKKNQVSTPKNGFTMIWFDYIFLFPLCVGWLMWRWEAICLIFTKYNLIWAPTKKIRSLLPKMASQWSDLPIFSFFSFVWGG
mgnify:CR=1 FL=1